MVGSSDNGKSNEAGEFARPLDDSRATVPLHREEVAVTRKIERGDTVNVSTITRTRNVPVAESVSRERIEIDRILIGREVSVAPEVSHDGDLTIIPVVKEVLVVQRRLILEEEIHIRRVRFEAQHEEIVTVREQEAVITRVPNSGGVNSDQPDSTTISTTGEPT